MRPESDSFQTRLSPVLIGFFFFLFDEAFFILVFFFGFFGGFQFQRIGPDYFQSFPAFVAAKCVAFVNVFFINID